LRHLGGDGLGVGSGGEGECVEAADIVADVYGIDMRLNRNVR